MTMIGDYIIEKQLGEGSYGVVKLAKHQLSGEKVAIKISSEAEIAKEYEILKTLSHPNIVSVLGVLKVPLAARSKSSQERGLVMECVEGGDLVEYITKQGPLPEQTAMKFLVQILSAISHCHKNRVAHRDLKPDNILFNSYTGNLILCDFGLATICPSNRFLEGKVGSLLYCAPEILCDVPYSGYQTDMWSAGVVFYCLLSGCVPWQGFDLEEQLENAVVGNYYKLTHLSKDTSQLLASLLNVNAERRPTAEQALEHLSHALHKYRSGKSILSNQSQYWEEDGAGSDLSCDGISDEEGEQLRKKPIQSKKAGASQPTKYNLRVIPESELNHYYMFQYTKNDIDSICHDLEKSFKTFDLNFRTINRKKTFLTDACFKYQCKNAQCRFDIEICTTRDNKRTVVLCRNIKGDISNLSTILNQFQNKRNV